ncbi:ribonuclease H-like domain-containing protein [Tanacetum coccineum]
MGVVYVLNTSNPEDGGDDATVEQIRKRAKWDNDDYLYRGLILNGMSDSFLIFTRILNLPKNYGIPWRTNIWLRMHQVSCIIDKLPSSWKDFKHKKQELTLVELGIHLCIEESPRAQDNDKPKGNNVVGLQHKYHADGSLSRYKACLVANGRSQQIGADCGDAFSRVVKPATIRTILSLALSRGWPVHQLDVKNAFLNAVIIWFETSTIIALGACQFHQLGPLRMLFLKRDISKRYTYVPLSKNYVMELSEQAHMVNCNPTRTPVDTESNLGPYGDPPHLAALKRVLCYVRGTLDFGLHLYASPIGYHVAYYDADRAGSPSTRRSTSGYCVFLGDNLLSWSSKRQHTISRSSYEAEYQDVANAVAEIV